MFCIGGRVTKNFVKMHVSSRSFQFHPSFVNFLLMMYQFYAVGLTVLTLFGRRRERGKFLPTPRFVGITLKLLNAFASLPDFMQKLYLLIF